MSSLDKLRLFRSVGYEPHAGQREVHLSDARHRVVSAGVGWGLTTSCIHEALAALLEPGPASTGWIVVPTPAAADGIATRLLELLDVHFAHRLVHVDRRRRVAVVQNLDGAQARVEVRSAVRADRLVARDLRWLLVDDAADIKDQVWRRHFERRADAPGCRTLVMSTPESNVGWFPERVRKAEAMGDTWASWQRPSWEHPGIERDDLAAERERLTERQYFSMFGGEVIGPAGRLCPQCRWSERCSGLPMSDIEFARCTTCPECGRTLDEAGLPRGTPLVDGRHFVTVKREAHGTVEAAVLIR